MTVSYRPKKYLYENAVFSLKSELQESVPNLSRISDPKVFCPTVFLKSAISLFRSHYGSTSMNSDITGALFTFEVQFYYIQTRCKEGASDVSVHRRTPHYNLLNQ